MTSTFIVDLVRTLVFAAAHVCGNSLGSGIFAVSLMVRIALLPLTLRAARRQMAHQNAVKALEPKLAQLKRRHANDRARLGEATVALYAEHDLPMLPQGMLGALLVQIPVSAALYRATSTGLGKGVRFLWSGDLSRPDAIIAATAAGLAGIAAGTFPGANRSAMYVSAAITFVFACRLSASVGLYWAASNAVSAVQSFILRRSAA